MEKEETNDYDRWMDDWVGGLCNYGSEDIDYCIKRMPTQKGSGGRIENFFRTMELMIYQ